MGRLRFLALGGGQRELSADGPQPPHRHHHDPVAVVLQLNVGTRAARSNIVQGLAHRDPLCLDWIGHCPPTIATGENNTFNNICYNKS